MFSVPDTSQGGSFCLYFSYFLLSLKLQVVITVSNVTTRMQKIQAYAELIWQDWQCVHNKEVHEVSIP